MGKEKKDEKRKAKEEKKQEKKQQKLNVRKSKENLSITGSPSKSPKFFRKNRSTPNLPEEAGQCSPGKKRKNMFKRIGSFILPTTKSALAPASPPAVDMRMSQSHNNIRSAQHDEGVQSGEDSIHSPSTSTPNLMSPPSFLPPKTPKAADYKELKVERSNSGKITGYRVNSITAYSNDEVPQNLPNLKVESLPDGYDNGPDPDPYDVIDLVVQEIEQGELQCGVSLLTKDERVERVERSRHAVELDKTDINYEEVLPDLSFESESPRRSSLKNSTPRIVYEKTDIRRVSFHEEKDATPEILKMDLASTLNIPSPPPILQTSVSKEFDMSLVEAQFSGDDDDVDIADMTHKERCQTQQTLLTSIRERMLATEEENARLRSELSENKVYDIKTIKQEAAEVLKENRLLIKERELSEARWRDIIEERNTEVSRIRSLYSNLEDQNDTLIKRCKKLEEKNEELRDAYNAIAVQNDDFVPVRAHLSSVEGYKLALEELRKKYDDNIYEKKEEVEMLERNVAELTEKLEALEEEKSLLQGQNKGLKETLTKTQQNAAKYKREIVNLTERINTLKSSLAQAISIAENSTLQKIELAEILQISDNQERQKRNYLKSTNNTRVKEVKKIANAKIRSCADILMEREAEYEKNLSHLHSRITKLKLRCKEKDEQIINLSNSGSGNSN